MRLATLATLALVAGLAGCGGPEPAPDENGRGARTATLTVVVWSGQVQRAVPATGFLTSSADGQQREVDTRPSPEAGQVFTGLAPGPYRLQVTRRYDGTRAQAVEGVEELYLEPGAALEVTIVATDKPGELGWRVLPTRTSSPSVAASTLPQTPPRPAGPS